MLQMLISLLKHCSVTPSVSSLKATASTGWTLMKPQWWVTEMTRQTFHTSLCLSLHSAFLTYSQWIVHFAEKRCSRISADLQWRYTSRYYQRAVGELLIRCSRCFPSPADLQCVVPTVHRVQPAAVLPALPSPLLPSAASPLRRQPNRLSGTFLLQLHVILLASLLKSWRLSVHLYSRFPRAPGCCWVQREFCYLCVLTGGGGVLVPGCVFGALTFGPSAVQHGSHCLMSAVGGQRFWLGDTVVHWGHSALSDADWAISGVYRNSKFVALIQYQAHFFSPTVFLDDGYCVAISLQ